MPRTAPANVLSAVEPTTAVARRHGTSAACPRHWAIVAAIADNGEEAPCRVVLRIGMEPSASFVALHVEESR